jgi:hypothetical protein
MDNIQTNWPDMILLNQAVNQGVVILIEFYADGLPYAVTYKVERTEDSVHLDCIGTGDEVEYLLGGHLHYAIAVHHRG